MNQNESTKFKRLIPSNERYFAAHPTASPGLQAGEMVFVAGQVGRDANGEAPLHDVIAQFHLIMENLKLVLAEAGGTLNDVVRLTQYVTDLAFASKLLREREAYFPKGVPPSATVGVTGLVKPEYLIEVDAIAIVGGFQ